MNNFNEDKIIIDLVKIQNEDGDILWDIETIKAEFNKILFQLQQHNAEIEFKKIL